VKNRKGKSKGRKPAKEPTRDQAVAAAMEWAAELNSTLTALEAMLRAAEVEVRIGGAFKGLFHHYEIETVRVDITNAICTARTLWPINPLHLEIPTPTQLLSRRKGGA
jgi:hypothetical protein